MLNLGIHLLIRWFGQVNLGGLSEPVDEPASGRTRWRIFPVDGEHRDARRRRLVEANQSTTVLPDRDHEMAAVGGYRALRRVD